MFGVVLQDPYLFTGTLAENIRLGTEGIHDEAVEAAAEQVNLMDFIRSLPEGFGHSIRERGSGLSTGQKQLISFARALAHNPRYLILDEATSSVDTETEFRVRDALNRMVEGRTSVVIAHRLSTIQRADRILVMHKGKLRESGTHQELLAQRGIYWKLYQLQYKDQERVALGEGKDVKCDFELFSEQHEVFGREHGPLRSDSIHRWSSRPLLKATLRMVTALPYLRGEHVIKVGRLLN